MAKSKLKKFLKKAGKAAAAGVALYGASKMFGKKYGGVIKKMKAGGDVVKPKAKPKPKPKKPTAPRKPRRELTLSDLPAQCQAVLESR